MIHIYAEIRNPLVAILAAFGIMLGACGGGGGAGNMARTGGPNTGGPTPTPSGGLFPTKANTIVLGDVVRQHTADELAAIVRGEDAPTSGLYSGVPPTGLTLENLVHQPPGAEIKIDFQQYSDFDFSAATPSGLELHGATLSKATKEQADRYAAVAYRGVLEHSTFLFQGGIYNYLSSGKIAAHYISIGTPPTGGNVVAGTWKGVAIGQEHWLAGNERAISNAQAERHIALGNVELSVTMGGSSPSGTIGFGDWQGGTHAYPDTSVDVTFDIDNSENSDFRWVTFDNSFPVGAGGDRADLPDGLHSVVGNGYFYGPERQEAGGHFLLNLGGENAGKALGGVWGAKKQAE